MKLEVGQFVRTENKGICKIEGFASSLTDDYIENEKGSMIPKDEVLKTSHNIIDLIEVGDYVNGYRVCKISKYKGDIELYIDNDGFSSIWKGEIETIVTKEQFAAMAYKVV